MANGVLNFKVNLLPGAYTPPETVLSDMAPTCSSGECSFPDFVSLGVCTKATNISSRVNVTRVDDQDWHFTGLNDNTTWAASLPGHDPFIVPNIRSFYIFPTQPEADANSSATSNERSLSLADMRLVFANTADPPANNVTFEAVEVLFYWCTKAFSVSVRGGVPVWTEKARSAVVLANTAISFDVATNPKYQGCLYGTTGVSCVKSQWGNLTLAPPAGFETHAPIVVNELSALTVSALLQMSFWSGEKPPFWATNAAPKKNEPGMFIMGDTIYRVEGDISMALGSILWRHLWGTAANTTVQFAAVSNMTQNMGKAIEN